MSWQKKLAHSHFFRLTSLLILLTGLLAALFLVSRRTQFFPKAGISDAPEAAGLVTPLTLSKSNIISLPYVIYDWENCNPKTLKRGGNPAENCFQEYITPPAAGGFGSNYYLGSFGSHVYFTWSQLVDANGNYDFSPVAAVLQQAADMEVFDTSGIKIPFKPVVIAFPIYFAAQSGFLDFTPDVFRNQIPLAERQIEAPGCSPAPVPAYGNSAWLGYYEDFVKKTAEFLKNSPNAYVVQAVLIANGFNDETKPTENRGGCNYQDAYRASRDSQYDNFVNQSLLWYHQAYLVNGRHRWPVYLQAAAAPANKRIFYEKTAQSYGIGIKLNGLAPTNANGYNSKNNYGRGGNGGVYDFVDATSLSLPTAFETKSQFVIDPWFCSENYCYAANASYQGAYWAMMTGLAHKGDFYNLQKVYFQNKRDIKNNFNIDLDEIIQASMGKAPNQTTTAWVVFADKLIDQDSIPQTGRPAPPVSGNPSEDFYPYEFAERGDRDFYLYRVGDYEDSSLIRSSSGLVPDGQVRYALSVNRCYDGLLANSRSRYLSGQTLRSGGYLAASEFSHPFSVGGLATDKANAGYYIYLNLEDATDLDNVSEAKVEVSYLDFGTDSFSLEFKKPDGSLNKKTVNKTNSKTWKKAAFLLGQGEFVFNNSLGGKADLRLNCDCESGGADDIFHMVRIASSGLASSLVGRQPNSTLAFCASGSNLPTPTVTTTPPAQPTSTPAPTNTPGPTNTPAPTSTPQPTTPPGQPTYTPVPTATSTPVPTNTPGPTSTIAPTVTPGPTATPTVIPTPTGYQLPGVPGYVSWYEFFSSLGN